MSNFVLDASVTMTWCFPDEHSDYASGVLNRLMTQPARVPNLWPIEVANAVLVGERRKRLSASGAARFLELLRALPIEFDGRTGERALAETLTLARAHLLSAYDAAYLELAMREALPLATLDQRLRQASKAVGVLTI